MERFQEVRIKDFYQAVLLKTLGFPLLRLEKGNGKFVFFVFDDPQNQAEAAIERYWNREVEVVVRDFVENIKELKNRIFTGI